MEQLLSMFFFQLIFPYLGVENLHEGLHAQLTPHSVVQLNGVRRGQRDVVDQSLV